MLGSIRLDAETHPNWLGNGGVTEAGCGLLQPWPDTTPKLCLPPFPFSATWTLPSTWTSRASYVSSLAPPTTGCAEVAPGWPSCRRGLRDWAWGMGGYIVTVFFITYVFIWLRLRQ